MDLLSAMITPAVLISACGTLILSTSTRLARIVDRVRVLSDQLERLSAAAAGDDVEARLAEVQRQLASHAERGRLIQSSLTNFYLALGMLVATTMSLGVGAVLPLPHGLPGALGILATIVLFAGCVTLIRETRMALRSVKAEMEFVTRLAETHRRQSGDA